MEHCAKCSGYKRHSVQTNKQTNTDLNVFLNPPNRNIFLTTSAAIRVNVYSIEIYNVS